MHGVVLENHQELFVPIPEREDRVHAGMLKKLEYIDKHFHLLINNIVTVICDKTVITY